MNIRNFLLLNRSILLIALHILLGFVVFAFPLVAKFYGLFIVVSGLVLIFKSRNRNQEVLICIAYIVGSEVLLRSTNGSNWEFAKYFIIFFSLLGIAFSGYSKKTRWYIVYLLLLFPSLFLSNDLVRISAEAVREIVFNLSGPVSLGIFSIYTFGKKIPLAQLNRILLAAGLPVLTMCVYVFLSSPQLSTITSVESNAHFSGMFGPNQVAMALGVGFFIFFTQALFNAASKLEFIVFTLIASFSCYTGLLTFSRGGIITGACATVAVLVFTRFFTCEYGAKRAKITALAFVASLLGSVALANYQTHGLIVLRYTNRDHLGRTKRDKPSDRRALAAAEVNLFFKNPAFGVGITEGDKIRGKRLGMQFNSHDEVTRMLAEHGSLGFAGMLILILMPAWLFLYSRQNLLLLPFFVFWFLTINHSGTRIAAPLFFYGLMLLHIELEGSRYAMSALQPFKRFSRFRIAS